MKYDDASWHCGGDFPGNSPIEYGGTHIALFLKWCFRQGWAGELHTGDEPEAVAAVIDGKMSATDFLFQYCDGKLTDEDFNEAGNEFASQYYGEKGLYLDDYADAFGNQMYRVPESEHDYSRFSEILEERFKSNSLVRKKKSRSGRAWWKFWN